MKKRLGNKESVSKQGRKNAKPEPTFDVVDDLDADLSHGMDYMETDEPVNEERHSNETEELKLTVDTEEIAEGKGSGKKGGSTEELVSTAVPETVSTARPEVSTARPDVDAPRQEVSVVEPRTPPTTTNFNDEEMNLADTLVKLKDDKAKGVAFKDTKEIVKPARSVLTLKPLPTIDPKDKSKGVLEEESEPAKKMTRSDFDAAQIARDEEVARQLEVEWQAEMEKERQREEQASIDYISNLYDEVQARMDVDHELAVRLTHEEQEKYIVEERANGFCKELASPKQMALGKDFSNPLIVDSLLKTIWLSMHHVIAMKHWLF
ncbi:hypothetical protein Tco_1164851 [Tanacetum coccineum]